jgi:hypothetical protein
MQRLITMSTLGQIAQAGNHLAQYAFLRWYAHLHGAEYQCPRWVGQYLFGFQDPPVTVKLPQVEERVGPAPPGRIGIPIPPVGDEWIGHDWKGYGQFDTAWYQPGREFIQGLYREPAEPQRSRVLPLVDKLRQRGKTLIGLHLRRGDSGRVIYPFTPIEWCLRWLHDNWQRFDDPVLYCSTEQASLASWFCHYNPVVAEDLGITFKAEPYPGYHYPFPIEPRKARQLDFFPDWAILQRCDVLLASDSSFSMTAAWTSTTLRECWRMKLSLRDFERTDPWDMHFCNREHLDDYPGIPGTAIDSNPGFGWEGFRPKHKAVPEDPTTFQPYLRPR